MHLNSLKLHNIRILCVLTSMYPICTVILIPHSRTFVFDTMDFLRDERQFISSFLKVSRERYGHLLFLKSPNHTSTLNTRHLYDASVSHTVRGFVEEVKQCVNLVHSKHIPMQLRS